MTHSLTRKHGSVDVGPLDIKILELKDTIVKTSNENADLQAKWLARQNELINLQKVWYGYDIAWCGYK